MHRLLLICLWVAALSCSRPEASPQAPLDPAPPAPPTLPAAPPVQAPPTAQDAAEPDQAPPEPTPRPSQREEAPLGWAQVTAPGRNIYQEIGEQGARLGSLRRGHPFPIYERAQGPRCQQDWVRVGPQGWACSEDFEDASGPPPEDPGDPMPFRYTITYKDTPIHHQAHKRAQTGRIRKQKSTLTIEEETEGWVRVFPDEWLPKKNLIPRQMRDYRLRGEALSAQSSMPLAFARIKGVKVYPEPNLSKARQRQLKRQGLPELRRFDRRPVLEQFPPGARFGGTWLRVEEGWVPRHQVALVTQEERPSGIDPEDKWILVDLSEQTVVAYQGDQPVYATLTSTGKGKDGEDTQTPRGKWKIHHKLRSTRMSGGTGASYHWLSDVPWVQYFHKGYALHGVYWHNSFGWVQSQGCVNLTPVDAQWFFFWTQPDLPTGWYSKITQPEEPSTWVVVQR